MNGLYFCTFFDSRYLGNGLALHHSLIRQGRPFHLWILCLDAIAEKALARLDLPNVSLVSVNDLVQHDQDILVAKGNRSAVEFYFTCKSFLCLYILGTQPHVELITYLDADVYFFGDPTTITDEMEGFSIGITPHRFLPYLEQNERFGLYNAGFISIRCDDTGLAGLKWWRDRCLEWCHDHISDGRFADQGYLNRLPELFRHVRVIDHKGLNAAPWNISQYPMKLHDDNVVIDGFPLVMFHFHGIKRMTACLYDSGMASYNTRLRKVIKRNIYLPYVHELSDIEKKNFSALLQKDKGPVRGKGTRFKRLEKYAPAVLSVISFVWSLPKNLYYNALIMAESPVDCDK